MSKKISKILVFFIIVGVFTIIMSSKVLAAYLKLSRSNTTIEFGESIYYYQKGGVVPKITVTCDGIKLHEGKQYNLKIYNNKKDINSSKGREATVEVSGKAAYKGTIKRTFVINKCPINDVSISIRLIKDTYIYSGSENKPGVVVKQKGKSLEYGKDYTLEWSNNKNVGKGKVKIIGKGNYKGTVLKTFTIKPLPLKNNVIVRLNHYNFKYNGKAQTPTVRVNTHKGIVLKNGKDYTVTFPKDTKNAGSKLVVVNGKGNYTGSVTIRYEIEKISLQKSDIEFDIYIYNKYLGKIPPISIYGLKEGKDYIIDDYVNNAKKGMITVKIKGIGNYKGTVTKTFKISG